MPNYSGVWSLSEQYQNASGWPLAPNPQRALFAGGNNGSSTLDVIQYISMDTLGNASDFGDLTVARYFTTACSSLTRGVIGGGSAGSNSDVIDFVNIASTGNASDFGDLTAARVRLGACSSATRGVFAGGEN